MTDRKKAFALLHICVQKIVQRETRAFDADFQTIGGPTCFVWYQL